jgi:hypothetical protein
MDVLSYENPEKLLEDIVYKSTLTITIINSKLNQQLFYRKRKKEIFMVFLGLD